MTPLHKVIGKQSFLRTATQGVFFAPDVDLNYLLTCIDNAIKDNLEDTHFKIKNPTPHGENIRKIKFWKIQHVDVRAKQYTVICSSSKGKVTVDIPVDAPDDLLDAASYCFTAVLSAVSAAHYRATNNLKSKTKAKKEPVDFDWI